MANLQRRARSGKGKALSRLANGSHQDDVGAASRATVRRGFGWRLPAHAFDGSEWDRPQGIDAAKPCVIEVHVYRGSCGRRTASRIELAQALRREHPWPQQPDDVVDAHDLSAIDVLDVFPGDLGNGRRRSRGRPRCRRGAGSAKGGDQRCAGQRTTETNRAKMSESTSHGRPREWDGRGSEPEYGSKSERVESPSIGSP